MSCSKPLPPFTFDFLCYLTRYEMEQLSIKIRRGSYALTDYYSQWHPNRADYSAQQFLDGRICSIDESKGDWGYVVFYSFAEMRPYLGPTVRIDSIIIYVARKSTYNPEHIAEMESITHLWRDGEIAIQNDELGRTFANYFQPILNSPTILQCRTLIMRNAHFSFKDYEGLYTAKVIEIRHTRKKEIDIWLQYWQQFLEQPGFKPVVVFDDLRRKNIDSLLDRLSKAFSSDVSPNAFKIVFVVYKHFNKFIQDEHLTEFRETNKTSDEILELKKGIPTECQKDDLKEISYTLERSSI